ncbi:DNA-binding barrel domain superfamily [Sesbania bispinosa]|nr:DNA-binding barrel domain superfamily [Sesbania bispinosa]
MKNCTKQLCCFSLLDTSFRCLNLTLQSEETLRLLKALQIRTRKQPARVHGVFWKSNGEGTKRRAKNISGSIIVNEHPLLPTKVNTMFEHTAEYVRQRRESFTANLRSTQRTIIIHREFFEHWIDQILDMDVKLTDPVGNVHTLRVRKHEKIGFFREGVTEMIKFYGLEGRHSIQFRYNDNKRFDIQIMDSESEEIQYPILLNQPHAAIVPPFVAVVPPPPGYMVPPHAAVVPPPPGYMVPPLAAVVAPPAGVVPPPPAAVVHFLANAAVNEQPADNENLQEDVVGWDFIATPPFI